MLWYGLDRFKRDIDADRKKRFAGLAKGQTPRDLFICCADSRLVPCEKFAIEPGDVFTLRVAGNIVPCFGTVQGGEEASIILALELGVENILVMGHSDCGAMNGLLNPSALKNNAAMRRMLVESGTQASWVDGICCCTSRIHELTKRHVVQQLKNLETYPMVKEKMDQGKVHLYGLLFDIPELSCLAYDRETDTWMDSSKLNPEVKA